MDDIDAIPDVEKAYGVVQTQDVYVIGSNGKLVGGNGPPGFALNYTERSSLDGDQILTLAEGKLPDRRGRDRSRRRRPPTRPATRSATRSPS